MSMKMSDLKCSLKKGFMALLCWIDISICPVSVCVH